MERELNPPLSAIFAAQKLGQGKPSEAYQKGPEA